VAAVIVEPIQSVAGVYMATPDYYRRLREYTSDHGIYLIFDEVQTGSGRTGQWYAGTHWGVEPDIVTTAKGVGGGVPAGVVITNQSVSEKVEPGDQATTFGGSPLAAAAIRATYEIIEKERLVERVRAQSAQLVARLVKLDGVREVRGLGYLLGLESELPANELSARLLDERILVGTCSEPHTIRLLPPLTVGEAEWESFLQGLQKVLNG
jgi:acetylornithine/N-succinyldiaminopimelate aminotransferase